MSEIIIFIFTIFAAALIGFGMGWKDAVNQIGIDADKISHEDKSR